MHKNNIKIISDFRLGDRDLSELAQSIKQRGLLQPMLLVPTSEDGVYEVAAGRSRFKAMTEVLGMEEFEEGNHFIVRREVDPLVAQLEENVKRKDFSPLEVANLINTIHQQKQAEHGVAVPGASGGWAIKDTGKLVGMSSSTVAGYLKLWRNRDIVDAGMSASEALEKVRNERASDMINKVRKVIAEKVHEKIKELDDSFVQACIDNFKHADAIEYVRSLNEVNHVITDPPYGINYDEVASGGVDYKAYKDSVDDYWVMMKTLVPEFARIVNDGYIVIWCAIENVGILKALMEDNDIVVSSTPLAWVKTKTPGFTSQPDRMLASCYEVAIYGWRGSPQLNRKGKKNYFEFPAVKSGRIHVAQKPVELMSAVIKTFTRKGESVLDCFGGSGSTLRACIKSKRMYFGCELDENFYNSAVSETYSFVEEMRNGD